MSDIKELTDKINKFRNVRDWSQFHNPKDMALSLILEAGEVLEHFQWKNEKEIKDYVRKNKELIGEELSDVLYWVLLMSSDMGIDLAKSFNKKMKQNMKKYPISKAKGKHTKYSQL